MTESAGTTTRSGGNTSGYGSSTAPYCCGRETGQQHSRSRTTGSPLRGTTPFPTLTERGSGAKTTVAIQTTATPRRYGEQRRSIRGVHDGGPAGLGARGSGVSGRAPQGFRAASLSRSWPPRYITRSSWKRTTAAPSSAGCGRCWQGLTATTPPTATIGIATARWRHRLASRGT